MVFSSNIDPRIIFWNARHCVLGTLIIVSISMYHTKFLLVVTFAYLGINVL